MNNSKEKTILESCHIRFIFGYDSRVSVLHPIALIQYDEKRINRKKKKKKKKKTRRSRLSYIVVDRLVVTTIRRSSLLFFFFFFFLFYFSSAFLLPSISLTSPLVYICSSGQFECMAKFGQARTTRIKERTSTRVNQDTIYRMMMNTCRADKNQRLLHKHKQSRKKKIRLIWRAGKILCACTWQCATTMPTLFSPFSSSYTNNGNSTMSYIR